jgi:hypothetical protein
MVAGNYIGPKQRPIIEALKQGAYLTMRYGKWTLCERGKNSAANRERCMGLYVRGFIMADGETEFNEAIYRLTEKGKRA